MIEKEIKGKITEIIDNTSGIIKGENQKEYYYYKVDFLDDFEPKVGLKVVFKEEQYLTNKEPIFKAAYISKDEKIDI